MKKILFFSLCMVIASQAFISCSKDETDLIDEYFKLKKERLSTISPNDLPQIAKIYSDAVTFSLGVCDADITLYISTDQNKLTATTNNMHHTWYNFESEHEQYTFTDLTPNTTYYYKVIVDRGYQQFDPTYNYWDEEIVLESPIQSFTTKPVTYTFDENYEPVINSISYAPDYNFNFSLEISGYDESKVEIVGDFYKDKPEIKIPITIYYSSTNSYPTYLLYSGYLPGSYSSKGQSAYISGSYIQFWDRDIILSSKTTYYFRAVINGISSEVKTYVYKP